MDDLFQSNSTSQTTEIFIADAASSPIGMGKTGLAFNTAGLTIYYRIRNAAAAVAITLVTQTVNGAWTSGGFVEIDSVHMPGLYRLDIPNAAIAAGANRVEIQWKGTNIIDDAMAIDLVGYDPTTVDKTGFSLAATGMNLINGYSP